MRASQLPALCLSRRSLLPLVMALLLLAVVLPASWLPGGNAGTLESGRAWSGTIAAGTSQRLALPQADPNALYSVLVRVQQPGTLSAKDALAITIRDAKSILAEQLLHQFDVDGYVVVRPGAAGPLTVECQSHAARDLSVTVTLRRWDATPGATATVEHEPNNSWQQANPIQLNSVVFGHCDDRQLYPTQHDPRPATAPLPALMNYTQRMPAAEARALAPGEDWFTFELAGSEPKLVYFFLDVIDREVPQDVTVWQVKDGKPVPFVQGIDPTSDIAPESPAIDPHEAQTRLANKFTTRVLPPGRYYLRVEGNHPAYQLRTYTYPVLRFQKEGDLAPQARHAVRAAMDYLMGAGDSWHSNTPRMGSVQNRVMGVHAETAQCIGCHPTHFSTRGHQTAVANGYPVKLRPALKFLTERLYNNPRPFYGHEDSATWGRMISASANVMSRLGYLVNLHEQLITGEPRTACLEGITGYLKIYYKGRTQLPPNETNGNTPVVSTYEVLGHSEILFDEMFRRTGKKEYTEFRDQLRRLNEQDNFSTRADSDKRPVMLDLCYQTANFVQIDPKAYADRIKKNCERILSLQRPDGQWSMLTSPKGQSVKFQTGHCLWVLALAGYGPEHPQVRKAIEYLLRTQQPWGGWFDSSSYENFKTPFRETQFAVMALSQLYRNEDPKRGPEQARGWHAGFPPIPERLNLKNEIELIGQLDQIWERPKEEVVAQIGEALKHPEVLVRQAAVEAAGRLAEPKLLADAARLLGDPSKVVRHSAAWALREYATRKQLGLKEIKAALTSADDATRRGAIRVLSQHFAYLTHDNDLCHAALGLLKDADPQVRMLASRAAWQWFWWTKDLALRREIVDAVVTRMGVEEHPHVERNLREAFYNITDENTRYLYNNWIPLLANQADRDQATKAQRAQMRMIGERVAQALAGDNEKQIDNVLAALGEFHLRRGGYSSKLRYGRIGNDVESIQFYAESRDALEPALIKLLTHRNPSIREHAAVAALTLKGAASDLPFHVLELSADDVAKVRALAPELQGAFPLPKGPMTEARLGGHLARLFASPQPEAHAVALATIGRVGGKLTRDETILAAVRDAIVKAEPQRLPTALALLPRFPALHKDKAVCEKLATTLDAEDMSVRRVSLETVLKVPALRSDKAVEYYANRLLRSQAPANREVLFEIVRGNAALAGDLEIVSVISEALAAKEEAVRREALTLVQKYPGMGKNPAVRLALQALLDDPSERLRQIAKQLYEGKGAALDPADVSKLLDFDYFVEKVQPIFARTGPDGQACALCHHTHTIFRLSRPSKDGTFTAKQVKEHYLSALRVIDLAKPEESLILRKPLSDAREEGVLDQKILSHGGGIRWSGTEDPDYRVILAWINGARLEKSERK